MHHRVKATKGSSRVTVLSQCFKLALGILAFPSQWRKSKTKRMLRQWQLCQCGKKSQCLMRKQWKKANGEINVWRENGEKNPMANSMPKEQTVEKNQRWHQWTKSQCETNGPGNCFSKQMQMHWTQEKMFREEAYVLPESNPWRHQVRIMTQLSKEYFFCLRSSFTTCTH